MSVRSLGKCLTLMFLALTVTVVISGAYVNAWEIGGNSYPLVNFDFTIVPTRTLVRMQPYSSGSLAIWVKPFCTNSTSFIQCDTTVLQTISLSLTGCPGVAYCTLDRQVVLAPPLYSASSEFVIYSFSGSTAGPSTITVTGTDQFGHTHSAQFGVILCYC